MFDHREGPLQVHRDYVVPLFLGHVENHAVSQDSRHRHHDVQLAEVVHRRLDDLLAAVHGGHRLRAGYGSAARLANLIDHLLRHRDVSPGSVNVHAQVAHHDLRAFRCHQLGDTTSDAAPGAGYDCYLVFQ